MLRTCPADKLGCSSFLPNEVKRSTMKKGFYVLTHLKMMTIVSKADSLWLSRVRTLVDALSDVIQ